MYFNANEDRLLFSGTRVGMTESLPDSSAVVPWDSLRVRADDGTPVFLLKVESPDSGASWILYFHCAGNTVGGAGNLEHYDILRDLGFNVLAVEYRGYGMSRDLTPSEQGLYLDAEAGWRYLTEDRDVGPNHIVLFSTSFGAGMATHIAAKNDAAGLVTKGAYTSAPAAARHLYRWLPAGLLMKNRFDNLGRAAAIDEPWLLFHAQADEVIPIGHAQALLNEAPRAKLVVLDGGHNNALDPGYRHQLTAALEDFKRGHLTVGGP